MEPHNDSTTAGVEQFFSQVGHEDSLSHKDNLWKYCMERSNAVQAMKHSMDCRLQLILAAFKASMSMDRVRSGKIEHHGPWTTILSLSLSLSRLSLWTHTLNPLKDDMTMSLKYHVSLHPLCQVLSQRMWMKRNLLSMLHQLQSNPVRGQMWPVQPQPAWLVRRTVATSPKRQATKVKSTQRHWRSRQMRAAQQVQLFCRIDVRKLWCKDRICMNMWICMNTWYIYYIDNIADMYHCILCIRYFHVSLAFMWLNPLPAIERWAFRSCRLILMHDTSSPWKSCHPRFSLSLLLPENLQIQAQLLRLRRLCYCSAHFAASHSFTIHSLFVHVVLKMRVRKPTNVRTGQKRKGRLQGPCVKIY